MYILLNVFTVKISFKLYITPFQGYYYGGSADQSSQHKPTLHYNYCLSFHGAPQWASMDNANAALGFTSNLVSGAVNWHISWQCGLAAAILMYILLACAFVLLIADGGVISYFIVLSSVSIGLALWITSYSLATATDQIVRNNLFANFCHFCHFLFCHFGPNLAKFC